MRPHEFLQQQVQNVEKALTETLRYEYGPRPIGDYYKECLGRLDLIKEAVEATDDTDFAGIEERLKELTALSVWISLIERSRLGEFSWPFAEALRAMAEALLVEPGLPGGLVTPIVHVIADGEGYFIHYEPTSVSGDHKFAFINFPRPLKHHVLLHSLFGHELGHTALHTAGDGSAGKVLQATVLPALRSAGPLRQVGALNLWICDSAAPLEVKAQLTKFQATHGRVFSIDNYYYFEWLDELICDLFGLLLFGPGFAAAHQLYLRPLHSNPYELALTHPPYAVRHKMLVRAMKLIGWDKPVAVATPHRTAEQDLLDYILLDQYDGWADMVSNQQLIQAMAGINSVFSSHGSLGYIVPNDRTLLKLVDQLAMRLPPIVAGLSNRGRPQLYKIDIAHTLYAGWIYFFGARHLTPDRLTFEDTNKLCDHALLQQRAINIAMEGNVK
jgi:hypothetical protein